MLCKDNWIDISWDGLPLRVVKENLQVKINRKAKFLPNFDTICNQTAVEIYDSHKNLYLALSGGSDSEYVASCLVRNRIPFTPLILNYTQATTRDQKYEQWYAIQWCKKHQIEPKIIDSAEYMYSEDEKQKYIYLRARQYLGIGTYSFLQVLMEELDGKLITGNQLEYYPDHEQMTYLEPQLGNYVGFVMEEADVYLETLVANKHPWAFYYWSPEVMASFVNSWDTKLTMQENKSAIYKTSPRPKFYYPNDFIDSGQYKARKLLAKHKWGTRDCALLGTKEHLLSQLLE